ncbi:MAG: NAD-dependent epimerase/dehydratase family protein [bacterium]
MTILVTGAPGWLGSRLVERLVADGRPVRCLVERDRQDAALARLGVERVQGDLRDPAAAQRACAGVDAVLHCAGIVHPQRFSDYRAIHVDGTRHLLEAAEHAGARRFCYVSSEAAQGYNRDGRPLTETDPCHPETEYGRTKRDAELATLDRNRPGGLETVVLRPAMFYGPGQPERRSRLMRMVASGRPPLFGSGENRRSMVYVDNVVDALVAASTRAGIGGELFWIADSEIYTTRGFFEAMAEALGVRLRPRQLPEALALGARLASRALERVHVHSLDLHVVGESPRDFFCSNAKALATLGWAPAVSLREGVRAAVEWWRAHQPGAGRSAALGAEPRQVREPTRAP